MLGAALFFGLVGCVAPRPGPSRAVPRSPSARVFDGAMGGPPLRILLKIGGRGLKASAPDGLELWSESGVALAQIPEASHARLEARSGHLTLDGDDLGVAKAWVRALEKGQDVRVDGRRYRGGLVLEAVGGRLALVNVVGLEDYLRGVLPPEVGPQGPAQALEAQAVAARSFAVAEAEEASGRDWDLEDGAQSQMYGSRDAERPATDAAVRATRGQVLEWRGKVAHAFFHSNSGGWTADAGEVWKGHATPDYLSGVLDTWSENQRHYRWNCSMSLAEAGSLLARAGLLRGALADVEPLSRSSSGRWVALNLVDTEGRSAHVGANEFRRALGADRVRSTRFSVRRVGDRLVFDGRGWGHGVGMSQEGAFAMARAGWDYRAILYFYYPGTSLARVGE